MAGPSGATARLALPYPIPNDTVDVPRDVQALAAKIDPSAVVYLSGTYAGRPAAGTAGRFYWCTDSKQLLYDSGSAWTVVNIAGGAPISVTALPASPVDGQEAYYRTASYFTDWHFRYYDNWTAYDGFGWSFLGGAPQYANVDTQENMSGNTWSDLPTVGPQLTVPLSGWYDVMMEAGCILNTAAIGTAMIGLSVAGANPAEVGAQHSHPNTSGAVGQLTSVIRKQLTAGQVIRMKYTTNAVNCGFNRRRLFLVPVRVA